jgi:hypothetical protein
MCRRSVDSALRRTALSVPATVVLAFLITTLSLGCQQGCATAFPPGALERSGDDLVFRVEGNVVYTIVWPSGINVEQSPEGLAVVDELGFVKAREGDRVRLQGGERRSERTWIVCGTIEVIQAAP